MSLLLSEIVWVLVLVPGNGRKDDDFFTLLVVKEKKKALDWIIIKS